MTGPDLATWPDPSGDGEPGEKPAEAEHQPERAVPTLTSVMHCPVCSGEREEVMPVDACQFFYECTHCRTLLRPEPGDCCVFCSYGSVPCPPRQSGDDAGCCQG